MPNQILADATASADIRSTTVVTSALPHVPNFADPKLGQLLRLQEADYQDAIDQLATEHEQRRRALPNQTVPVATATDIPTAGAAASVADESAVITSLDISSDSLTAVGLRELGRQQREILDLVIGAMRNGADDMTRAEIKDSYQRVYGKVIESGTVSARVAGLKAAGRLLQRERPRQCRVTGKTKTVVYVSAKQASLI